jgi:hypothetical protein
MHPSLIVTPGLDPGVHATQARDGRVKPGNDGKFVCRGLRSVP